MIIVIMTVCRQETKWERKGGWHGEKSTNQDSNSERPKHNCDKCRCAASLLALN